MNADAHNRATASEAGLTKFDPETLKGINSQALTAHGGAAFLPSSMAEAMELGKLMCLSNFVPEHLRGKPGDCLAVVMQSARWGMDPFAVANKTYFVNNRMAYEAQLVNAVLNTRAPLEGRLQVSWDGEGQSLTCKVVGKIKGDPNEHTVWQELRDIKTQNSPLWKSSPRQQLAYYTTRMWARLFAPEVLLGVYTDDEIRDDGSLVAQPDGSYAAAPARPQRADFTPQQATQAADAMDAEFTSATTGRMPDTPEERGEAVEQDFAGTVNMLLAKIDECKTIGTVNAVAIDYGNEIAALKADAPEAYERVQEAIKNKKAAVGKR